MGEKDTLIFRFRSSQRHWKASVGNRKLVCMSLWPDPGGLLACSYEVSILARLDGCGRANEDLMTFWLLPVISSMNSAFCRIGKVKHHNVCIKGLATAVDNSLFLLISFSSREVPLPSAREAGSLTSVHSPSQCPTRALMGGSAPVPSSDGLIKDLI